ncbi:MAG: hypothetical protein BJ554DRAFT_5186 [Olpidium bornovanus]|uniref:Sm domain-containing protein n=1 Tax=Olpidium bornovanus TaxID=278681 RepID=A0A8H8DE02_9FUNG|nr:MAG: hypothetical protein BJ554DRAFT_5186 [Olpidium bornovanus]
MPALIISPNADSRDSRPAGVLACLDGYMNIALEQTEEYAHGRLTNKYGDAFIRGNNGRKGARVVFALSGAREAPVYKRREVTFSERAIPLLFACPFPVARFVSSWIHRNAYTVIT